jgi:hypothetical protein
MNKRKFLEKFVALSSASLVVAGCATTQNSSTLGAIKNPNASQSIDSTKKHPYPPISPVVVRPIPKDDLPVPVYGPPPVR